MSKAATGPAGPERPSQQFPVPSNTASFLWWKHRLSAAMNRCDWADVTIMVSKAPREGINEAELKVGKPKTSSVGLPAVVHALKSMR
ncbi:MAG: hypothetical protein JWN05_1438 [Arthrobacter sp.]|jgi:hypothetical protein|nr:hypothetical protein [Arthrobacter sp.]